VDLNAYHRAWMNGSTEAEAVRAGEDAYFEKMAYEAMEREAYEAMEREAYEAMEREAYKAMEREAYEHEQRLIAEEHEANDGLQRTKTR